MFLGRSEEKCLVRSGLVQLMDRLCSLSSVIESSSNEKQTKKQKVATMAWAAFQVLANRCVEWEKEEGRGLQAWPWLCELRCLTTYLCSKEIRKLLVELIAQWQ